MVIKREVAYGIVRGLSEFWNCEELQDFTVVVGDTNFGCHRFLLAACSGFFRALFRSGMRETKLNYVTLEEVSSETFQLILETIYTGRGILTNDNVIDIWRAAHQLQVTFIVSECEMFVIKSLSLENYTQYFHYGRMLSSKIVTETVWTFILKNCNYFFKTSYFLHLKLCDVLSLIKSQNLATKSEDDVLKAILMWVQHTPDKELTNEANYLQVAKENIHTMRSDMQINENESSDTIDKIVSECTTTNLELKDATTSIDLQNVVQCNNSVMCEKMGKSKDAWTGSNFRKQYLFQLLSNTRTCLASHECLEMVLCHPLISDNIQARDVIIRALLYHLQIDKRNGQWPTGATHRNNSVCKNVAINFFNDWDHLVYSFSENIWIKYECSSVSDYNSILQFIIIGRSLYGLYVLDDEDAETESPLCISCLTDKTWSQIDPNVDIRLKSNVFSVVAVNEFIYVLQRNKFWKINPLSPSPVRLPNLPEDQPMCHLTCYDQNILAFYSMFTEGGVEETAVLSFYILNNTWTRLNNLEGPANGMISFKDDHSTYLLQSNGDMWKFVKPQSNVVDFEFVVKLWRHDWPLHGAVTFLDELYIYGVKSETLNDDPQLQKSVAGLFRKIIYLNSLESESTKSMFVPFIANRDFIS